MAAQTRSDAETDELPSDCTACGACCFTQQPAYLPLFGIDEARLTLEDAGVVQTVRGRRFMRIVEGRCAALRADPQNGQLLCSIYPRRPDVCRSLVRGSGECLRHHQEKREDARAWCDALRRTLGIV